MQEMTRFGILTKKRKSKLLSMAKKNLPKPSLHNKEMLGNFLNKYIRKSSPHFDPEFSEQLKRIRPDWFKTSQDVMKQRKKNYIKQAKEGGDIPHHKEMIWVYTKADSEYYDAKFTARIIKLRPDWFILSPEKGVCRKRTTSNSKEYFLNYARNNEDMPPFGTRDYSNLRNFFYSKSPYYDQEFAEEILKIRPNWKYKNIKKKTRKKKINPEEIIVSLKNEKPIIQNKRIDDLLTYVFIQDS